MGRIIKNKAFVPWEPPIWDYPKEEREKITLIYLKLEDLNRYTLNKIKGIGKELATKLKKRGEVLLSCDALQLTIMEVISISISISTKKDIDKKEGFSKESLL